MILQQKCFWGQILTNCLNTNINQPKAQCFSSIAAPVLHLPGFLVWTIKI
ncbi:hypothetical protein M23134_02459 [Microscilla marina ATCC 23134]|uniref:Uncharacterized protein n=1 Tax=Microscilla marina ATCC 23134 TaxID=313606 RepID=A1ZZY9_MICM2|nr:hypothetical protein M23134_02459 [Microscilla marina ATCC 23134]